MENAVISDRLLDLIKGRKVQAALFTTYTFEPEFFELEVIPLLLKQDAAYSTDERVKQFMVRENLREAALPIDVFYDLPMYRENGSSSPQMEYLCHGVNLGNRAFHGKVKMILLNDQVSGEKCLLLGAGSNNLTRAGWWDNIECQHWVEVRNGQMPRKFLNMLREEIAFLQEKRALYSIAIKSATNTIAEYLSGCRASNNAEPIQYFGLSHAEKRGSFIEFLRNQDSPLRHYRNWRLEIISPFFADDTENREHQIFSDLGIEDILLLLPMDDENNALCQDDYYQHIQKAEGIRWAHWHPELASSLGLANGHFRRLHAKVYHFYNGVQSWVFVGSVNFTHKALHENVEAGFLAKLEKVAPLLEAMPENEIIDHFKPPGEIAPGDLSKQQAEVSIPELRICYDWLTKALSGAVAQKRASYEIEIIGSEGEPAIDPWEIKYQAAAYPGDLEDLEKLLRNGSLVQVRGRNLNTSDKAAFATHNALVQQINWSHKPLDLPELSATQILAIYAGMSSERRQLMLMNAQIRALVLSAQAGELTSSEEDQVVEQFFSEYAEVFNAFRKLKQRLSEALDNEQFTQVDYYLTGAGVDSLKSLVKKSLEADDENGIGAVSSYLILLSAQEVYLSEDFAKRPNVHEESQQLKDEIQSLKKSDRLKLEDNSRRNRNHFFKWFETEFFRNYVTLESEA